MTAEVNVITTLLHISNYTSESLVTRLYILDPLYIHIKTNVSLNFPGSENKHFGLNSDNIIWFCKCALCRSNLAHNDIIDELPHRHKFSCGRPNSLINKPTEFVKVGRNHWQSSTMNPRFGTTLRAHHHFYSYSFIFIIVPLVGSSFTILLCLHISTSLILCSVFLAAFV